MEGSVDWVEVIEEGELPWEGSGGLLLKFSFYKHN
jgi:hypothetical protein